MQIEHSGAKAVLALPLGELGYVFKAGNLSLEKAEDLLNELRDNGMDPLSYIDYLAYIPMFIGPHAEAIQNPFGMFESAPVSSLADHSGNKTDIRSAASSKKMLLKVGMKNVKR